LAFIDDFGADIYGISQNSEDSAFDAVRRHQVKAVNEIPNASMSICENFSSIGLVQLGNFFHEIQPFAEG